MNRKIIDVGKDFSRYPAGRFKRDGEFSGEVFRENFLIPIMNKKELVTIKLDNTAGYGSSFLEEAFGGLVRLDYSAKQIFDLMQFESEDESLVEEINEYIEDADNKE